MSRGKNEIGYTIKYAQQALHLALDEALKGLGLTMSQYAVLFNLANHPGASSAELARLSFVTPQTMIRLVKSLERRGLVARTQSSRSSRILETQLTPKGSGALDSAQVEVDAVHSRMLSGIREGELERVDSCLKRMIQQLEEP